MDRHWAHPRPVPAQGIHPACERQNGTFLADEPSPIYTMRTHRVGHSGRPEILIQIFPAPPAQLPLLSGNRVHGPPQPRQCLPDSRAEGCPPPPGWGRRKGFQIEEIRSSHTLLLSRQDHKLNIYSVFYRGMAILSRDFWRRRTRTYTDGHGHSWTRRGLGRRMIAHRPAVEAWSRAERSARSAVYPVILSNLASL